MNLRKLVVIAFACAIAIVAAPATRAAEVVAFEFFHEAFGHYFMSAYASDATLLDQGTIGGWTRTANEFRVHDAPGPGLVPVCRFFTTAFAPKSSHFYSAFANECEVTRRNPDWTFEADAFYAALPNGAGQCPAGLRPVHRLYNNGRGGAPNHKFTASVSERDVFVTEGWTPEGLGNNGVAFCVPTRHSVALARAEALANQTIEFTYLFNGTNVVRLSFGGVTATDDDELPYEVEVTNRFGLAGYEPFGGRLVVLFETPDTLIVFAFEFAATDTILGCAYVDADIFAGLLGRCYPLSGRRV